VALQPALPVPPDIAVGRDGAEGRQDRTTLPVPAAGRHDVQTLFASESLGQALRQLAVYGRDGLPVVSPTGTSWKAGSPAKGVLHALARRVAGTAAETPHAQAAADEEPDDAQATLEHPPAPLPGCHIAEITITGDSPPAGRKLGDVSWPLAGIPVSVLRAGSVHPASRGITLAPGDRVSLLVPATQDPQPQDTEPPGRGPGPADSPPTDRNG
jgi:CIC family chloride channel protein